MQESCLPSSSGVMVSVSLRDSTTLKNQPCCRIQLSMTSLQISKSKLQLIKIDIGICGQISLQQGIDIEGCGYNSLKVTRENAHARIMSCFFFRGNDFSQSER